MLRAHNRNALVLTRFDAATALTTMRQRYRFSFLFGVAGLVACSNGGKVFDSSTNPANGADGPDGSSGRRGNDAGRIGSGGTGGSPGQVGNGGTGGDVSSGSGGTPALDDQCTGRCCPTASACYSSPAGKSAPGAVCLATQDNTGHDHIQVRQQWVHATKPAGLTDSVVYAALAGRSQLPWPDCHQTGGLGSGGDVEILDLFLGGTDLSKHYATLGYATYVSQATLQSVLDNGFCFGHETFSGDPSYRLGLADMSPSAGYPPGLPAPMALNVAPWSVGPTKATRLTTDFDLSTDRARLLAMLDPNNPSGVAKDGFGGVFFYDDATGTAHGFSPLSWLVVYSAGGSSHYVVPMREVETRSTFNDPAHPNCMGTYLADAIDPSTCQGGADPAHAAWGGGNCTAVTGTEGCGAGQGPFATSGYFLITELEQIFTSDFDSTLCVTYPGLDSATGGPVVGTQGFYDATTKSCKTPKWNPSDPVNGLPSGDWCAKTNAPATPDCHDAWRGQTFHVFAGAKIQLGGDGVPSLCTL